MTRYLELKSSTKVCVDGIHEQQENFGIKLNL